MQDDACEELLKTLSRFEDEAPDPTWEAHPIKELITSFQPDRTTWSRLVERFASSESAAVTAGLAWALADDARTGSPASSPSHISALSKTARSTQIGFDLCARCFREWIARGEMEERVSFLIEFLLAGFAYSGEAESSVHMSALSLLDDLEHYGLLSAENGVAAEQVQVLERGLAGLRLDSSFDEKVLDLKERILEWDRHQINGSS